MLSPLQEAVARLVAALPEAQDFVLAGGAALISRGSVARSTQDLDFFGLEPAAVDRLLSSDDGPYMQVKVGIARPSPTARAAL